ncbi:MAG: nucleoside kinase [Anaerolineales bacterium]
MTSVPVRFVEPTPEVEIHLPDGRTLCAPRGTRLMDFLRPVTEDFGAPIVAAVVNGDLRELTYPIQIEAQVRPVTMADADGARIYRRSLTFLLDMAFADLFPQASLTVDHSITSGGYYCQVSGRSPLSPEELQALETHMRHLVEEDLPFERLEIPLSDAVAYFQEQGAQDKLRLLAHRTKDYLTVYRFRGRMDYHHGYMVPSTGYLRWFDLQPLGSGFVLRYPRRHRPTELLPLPETSKLLVAFRQYGDWLARLGIDSVGALNEVIAQGRIDEIILVSEALHEQHIAEIARQIAESGQRIVLIAGPSSSGKTTFSRRLAVQLLALGLDPFPLELDNYFVDRERTPLDENGQPDFEMLEALDLQLLAEHLERLLDGAQVQLPRYNFRTGKREPGEEVQLKPSQLLILEGIHGLNDRLLPGTLSRRAYRIYVSALTQLNLDRHNRVSTTDTRLIRRIVRDARERGYNAAQTISRWEQVRRGEKRYIFPYQENADVMFNSALVYELAALKPYAEPLLRQVPCGTPEYIEARRLLALLEWFLPLDDAHIPGDSIVREFLGGSILRHFTRWHF